jgi:hypothetical protein
MTERKSKRKWRDSGLEDHGISRSVLRDLDAAERLNDDLRDARATIGLDADIRSAWVDLDSVRADLDVGIERTRLADNRSADVSIRAADALIPKRTAVEVATDTIGDARAALDSANTSFHAPASASSLYDNLPNPTQMASLHAPISKVFDGQKRIATPPMSDLFSPMADTLRRISAMSVSSVSELRGWERSFPSKNLSNTLSALGNNAAYELTQPVVEAMKE